MIYYIITEINKKKQYLKKFKLNTYGYVCPLEFTNKKTKAFKFNKTEAKAVYNKIGIGYAIE